MIQPLPELTFTFPHAGNKTFTLKELIQVDALPDDNWIRETAHIVQWWYCTEEPLTLTTSGTTGQPVPKTFQRKQVIAAARSSMPLLGPPAKGTSLLAIHSGFAGGRMLLIRALLANNNLVCVPPTANPLRSIGDTPIHYASFVPYQVDEILKDDHDTQRLSAIATVLIGGAAISAATWSKLCSLPNRIYSTYGMTETLSHIALRQAGTGDSGYTPVPGITITTDARGCIVAESDWLGKIITNDLAEWADPTGRSQQFIWRGRADSMINTGGILVSPDQIEENLSDYFNQHPEVTSYFVAGEPDERLGQRVVLFIESEHWLNTPKNISALENHCRLHLRKEQIPRRIDVRCNFRRTGSGKIDRSGTAEKIA